MASELWTASHVRVALRERYPVNRYAMFFEVSDATGARGTRYADAVSLSLWPSDGIHFSGFEIKVSRQDWLNELKQVGKSAAIGRYCDHWWVVAGNPGIVRAGELPANWGLIEREGDRLKVSVKAPKLEAAPLTREFIASFLRRASESDHGDLTAAVEKKIDAVRKQLEREVEAKVDARTRDHAQLRQAVAAFNEASGLTIGSWQPAGKIGEAVRFVMDGGLKQQQSELVHLRNRAERLAKVLGDICEFIEPKGAEGGN